MGGNEGGREATPTSVSIIDSYNMKKLLINEVMLSSLASKCQEFKLISPISFHKIAEKWTFQFKDLPF